MLITIPKTIYQRTYSSYVFGILTSYGNVNNNENQTYVHPFMTYFTIFIK